jgi:hypothetical protein
MNIRRKIISLGVFSLILFGSGCVPLSEQFIGNRVSSGPVAVLQPGGTSADTWQTFDILIDYQYKRDGDVLAISGTARLTQHYVIMYASLRDLRVFLFFLDDNQRVLKSSLIARSLSNEIDDTLQFKQSFQMPPGTTRIAFGYDGQVLSAEENHSFYLLPLNP